MLDDETKELLVRFRKRINDLRHTADETIKAMQKVEQSHQKADASGSNSTKLLYSHEDMVRLCDEAKRDQRHACAEAITKCDRDGDGQCIWFNEAHQAIMNAAI